METMQLLILTREYFAVTKCKEEYSWLIKKNKAQANHPLVSSQANAKTRRVKRVYILNGWDHYVFGQLCGYVCVCVCIRLEHQVS